MHFTDTTIADVMHFTSLTQWSRGLLDS